MYVHTAAPSDDNGLLGQVTFESIGALVNSDNGSVPYASGLIGFVTGGARGGHTYQLFRESTAVVDNVNVYAALAPQLGRWIDISTPNGFSGFGPEIEIRFPIGTAATQTSVTSVPVQPLITTTVITYAAIDIVTPYTAGATIIIPNPNPLIATPLMNAASNNPQLAGLYEQTFNQNLGSPPAGGVVTALIGNAPVAGAGFVIVRYSLVLP